jgi:hypothetical protein
MSDKEELVPEKMGQLVPPNRRPPTAIGAATPGPDDDSHRGVSRRGGFEPLIAAARRFLVPVFDVADAIADPIVAAVRNLGARTSGRA